MTKVKITNLYDCGPKLRKQFMNTNLGPDGGMQYTMRHPKFHGKQAKRLTAFYITDGDKVTSWALCFKHPHKINTKSRIRCLHIYTAPEYRGRGLAKMLLETAVKYSKQAMLRINVFPHSSSHPQFFEAMRKKKIISKKMIGHWIHI